MAKAPTSEHLNNLRRIITESLRVQLQTDTIGYINVGHALNDATARQNHAIFARRGCGKTLLLHESSKQLPENAAAVYLNCEDFKRHSFPNVLIAILRALFRELDKHLIGWFGRKHRAKHIVEGILQRLDALQRQDDERREDVKTKEAVATTDEFRLESAVGKGPAKFGASGGTKAEASEEIERTFAIYREKLKELDHWLPELKHQVKELIENSTNKNCDFFADRRSVSPQAC